MISQCTELVIHFVMIWPRRRVFIYDEDGRIRVGLRVRLETM
jgi:hypothetical protein